MTWTRRRFLEITSALGGAAAFGRSTGMAQQGVDRQGAPGVQLNVDVAGLPDYSRDLERYLIRLSTDARDRRKQIINAISTREQVLARQKSVVTELWKMLGGPLDRTPLNPRVVGTVERPGYRIERVTFESRPRLYVTANLYVPAGSGRRPAILGPLGHSVNGKAWPSYQKLFSNLARKGYVVLGTTRSARGSASNIQAAGPVNQPLTAEVRANTSTPGVGWSCLVPTSDCSARGMVFAGLTTC